MNTSKKKQSSCPSNDVVELIDLCMEFLTGTDSGNGDSQSTVPLVGFVKPKGGQPGVQETA